MDTEWVDDDICIHTELNLESWGNFLQKLCEFAKAFSSVHRRAFYLQLLRLAYSTIFSHLLLPITLKGVTSRHWHMALTPYCTGFLVPAPAGMRSVRQLVSSTGSLLP